MGICQGPHNYDILLISKPGQNFYYRGENPENLWSIDFYFISISGHYARKISKELYIGLEAGILPAYNWIVLAGKHFTKENTIWSSNRKYEDLNNFNQLFFGHLVVRWRPNSLLLEIDGGFRASRYLREVLFVDHIGFSNFYGAFVKPMFRIYKFSIGGRLDMGYMYGDNFKPSPEFVVVVSPVLRFNFK